MADYLTTVIEDARQWDMARSRSQQRELGWSDLAGCRSYMGFKIREEWASDDEDTWRAIAGTALHEWMAAVRYQALCSHFTDPKASFEVPVEYGGVKGHVDEVTWSPEFAVTDYKFPSKGSARLFDDPEVIEEKFIQVQGYAAGVMQAACDPDDEPPIVRLLVCPVDGTFDDWRVYERPFDREAADAALIRYAWVQKAGAAGEDLPKDKPYRWCERYCEFFRACRNGDERTEMTLITDPEMAAAVEWYGLAREAGNAADQVMKDLAPVIRGLHGTARGWKIRMSKAGSGRVAIDEAAIRRHYLEEKIAVPMRPVAGKAASLLVSREKAT